jgi:L-amino acid N-acyltransferase YncA
VVRDGERGERVTVRDAAVADLPFLRDVYNAMIPTSTVAWTETLQTLEERTAWFARQQERDHPVLVAEHRGEPIGFAAYGDFRGAGKWLGYRYTVEHTIHVRESSWGLGAGRVLLEALMDIARRHGMHVMVAAIDGDNTASIAFHHRLGFEIVARMPQVGEKFGRWLDLVLMQRILDDH